MGEHVTSTHGEFTLHIHTRDDGQSVFYLTTDDWGDILTVPTLDIQEFAKETRRLVQRIGDARREAIKHTTV